MTTDKIIEVFNAGSVCGVIVKKEGGKELTVDTKWIRDNIIVHNITNISYVGDEFEIEEVNMICNNERIKLLAM